MTKSVKFDIAGQRFGRYVAVAFIPDDSRYAKWVCWCDCGTEKIVLGQSLRRGATRSCGCLLADLNRLPKIHGESGLGRTKTYNVWAGMMDRCEWGGHPGYQNYGARGIKVCNHWHKFENFKADMGDKPLNKSIDRINNDLGYSPENCRWATRREQSLNTSRTRFVLRNGEKVAVDDIRINAGITKNAFESRVHRRGGDFVAALSSYGVSVTAWQAEREGVAQ